ncbi:helix-turn-helix domain-containing protein [Dyadobacter bucti]|uniref:helix-turn-helix domain-containing protein n=1 Tax=Dyadobacter bucti TaxID=2572203 RepID=UPI001E4B9904|nr:helix-turn-helix domain-containing protein [Dyadobacter bucti]
MPETILLFRKEYEMPNKAQPEQLLDRKTAARYLRVSPGTLAVWDCTKRYDLQPLKVGRSVRYRLSSLDKFIERNLIR